MTAWWSDQKIRATVNQEYIERELGSKKHQDALHMVLSFGGGLTDDTYLDWIIERSPRFFLILNHIGVPEKINELLDRSFDDSDLPLSQDALWELNLFGTTSETLDRKFFRHQFSYLVQDLEPGGHVEYDSWEVVPVDTTTKRPGIATVQASDTVLAYEHLYTRKKVPTSGEKGIDKVHFIMHLKALAAIQHEHLVCVWATYAQENINYVLLTPSTVITLKNFLDDPPKQFKCLEKHERQQTVLTWTHCLTFALAYLHSKGFTHKAIRPSCVSIDHNNKIYLNGYKALNTLGVEQNTSSYSGEIYEHGAPENWLRKPRLHESAPLKTSLPGGSRTSRRLPKATSSKADSASQNSSTTQQTSSLSRTNSKSAKSASSSADSTNQRPRNAVITTFTTPHTSSFSPAHKYFPTDVFSLTTILLTLLSSILGHSPKSFASHRSRHNRQAGRGNGPPDASFHKNLKEVETWMDTLAKEAGKKEKEDTKFWGAIVELVNVCRSGIEKESGSRITASELNKKVGGWVEWGLGRRRKCTCMEEPEKGQGKDKIEATQHPRPIPPRHMLSRQMSSRQKSPRQQSPLQTCSRQAPPHQERRTSKRPSTMDECSTQSYRQSIVSRCSYQPSLRRYKYADPRIGAEISTTNQKSSEQGDDAKAPGRASSPASTIWGIDAVLDGEDARPTPALESVSGVAVGSEDSTSSISENYMRVDDMREVATGQKYRTRDAVTTTQKYQLHPVQHLMTGEAAAREHVWNAAIKTYERMGHTLTAVDDGLLDDDGATRVGPENGAGDERPDWPLPLGILTFNRPCS